MCADAAMGSDPSNRWPWIAIAAGVVLVLLAVAIFYLNRPSSQVNINVGTPSPIAAASSPSPPPTLVPPTLPASASPEAAVSPVPAPTASPVPTPAPSPSPSPLPPAPPSPPPVVAASPPVGQAPVSATQQPGAVGQASPVAPAGAATGAPTPAGTTPTATPFTGQVSAGGGLGNTRADIDAAYGQPLGQTSNGLVVFRRNNFEYRVGLEPDLNGRAALIVEQPVQTGQLPALQQAQAEAHRLLPTDAQPPNPTAEGNEQFVVERFTSQNLAQVLPPQAFTAGGGQPGSFLIVYVRDPRTGNIARWILGPGSDPNALIGQAG